MKKLIDQIIKFSAVGFICFFIDYFTGLAVMNILLAAFGEDFYTKASVIASVCGFSVSVVFNYILSFKFVFERKEDLDRKIEFIAFVILSVIGLGLNSLLMWLAVGPVYNGIAFVRNNIGYSMMYTIAKVFATAVVMVYNFITRKIFLENKEQ